MNALPLLEMGLLLGLYVLLAGAWGLLYALDRAHGSLRVAAEAGYALHGLAAVVILLWTPLGFGWKCVILAVTAAFRAIPPVVWRFLEHTHRNGSSRHDREHPQRSARIVARL
jgi:hypothetical protein